MLLNVVPFGKPTTRGVAYRWVECASSRFMAMVESALEQLQRMHGLDEIGMAERFALEQDLGMAGQGIVRVKRQRTGYYYGIVRMEQLPEKLQVRITKRVFKIGRRRDALPI